MANEHVKLYFENNPSEKRVFENDSILFLKKAHADRHGKTETVEHLREGMQEQNNPEPDPEPQAENETLKNE